MQRGDSRRPAVWRSLGFKLLLLLVIFACVPAIVYGQFDTADRERMRLIWRSLQTEGELVAHAISPLLQRFSPAAAQELSGRLNAMVDGRMRIKVLFRPAASQGAEGFLYMAAAPALEMAMLEDERRQILVSGVLSHLGNACESKLPTTSRLQSNGGREELLTSLTPLLTPQGCWVVIVAHAEDDLAGASYQRPYWQTPEVRVATVIYFLMALLVLALFFEVWRSLQQFQQLARRIGDGNRDETFARLNQVPELHPVAQAFDHLVRRLISSEELIRQAAEDNAHALKGPVAVIAQALEPLKRARPALDERARRSVDVIEQSVGKLDSLVTAARQMDESLAAILHPERRRIELSTLLRDMINAYRQGWPRDDVALEADIATGLVVLANEELIEEVFENLVENALGFAPPGGLIRIAAAGHGDAISLCVEDNGPGVQPDRLERMFDRYYTDRSASVADCQRDAHDGIGLWLVRRNIETLGGHVAAELCQPSGLRLIVTLPAAR